MIADKTTHHTSNQAKQNPPLVTMMLTGTVKLCILCILFVNTMTRTIHDDKEETYPLCQTKKHHWQPRAARHSDGRYVFMINGTEEASHFVQLVEVVLCVEHGAECRVGNTMARQRTRCRQAYRHQRMLLVDVEGHQVRDEITVPSGCFCQII